MSLREKNTVKWKIICVTSKPITSYTILKLLSYFNLCYFDISISLQALKNVYYIRQMLSYMFDFRRYWEQQCHHMNSINHSFIKS